MDRKWWTLAGACSGLFLLMLDSTVVALALPDIRGDVGASSEGLQWDRLGRSGCAQRRRHRRGSGAGPVARLER